MKKTLLLLLLCLFFVSEDWQRLLLLNDLSHVRCSMLLRRVVDHELSRDPRAQQLTVFS